MILRQATTQFLIPAGVGAGLVYLATLDPRPRWKLAEGLAGGALLAFAGWRLWHGTLGLVDQIEVDVAKAGRVAQVLTPQYWLGRGASALYQAATAAKRPAPSSEPRPIGTIRQVPGTRHSIGDIRAL